MRIFLRVIVVAVLFLGGIWLIQNRKLAPSGREVRSGIDSVVRETKEAVKEVDLKLDVHELGEELKRTGRIVRRKAGQAIHEVADDTEDARTTAAIKTRLAIDPNLSALDISVDTTDGRVTLAGHVDSADDIARAIRIVLDRNDVREVVSTIQVRRPDAKRVSLVR
jgi:osmotically-inducible protein OsmY